MGGGLCCLLNETITLNNRHNKNDTQFKDHFTVFLPSSCTHQSQWASVRTTVHHLTSNKRQMGAARGHLGTGVIGIQQQRGIIGGKQQMHQNGTSLRFILQSPVSGCRNYDYDGDKKGSFDVAKFARWVESSRKAFFFVVVVWEPTICC